MPPKQDQQSPFITLAINSTPLRRFAVLAAIKALKHFRPRRGDDLFLTDRLCVKYGSLVQISKAYTLQFVAKHTSIPVPKVHCAFVHHGWTYIVMERIDGSSLANEWLSRSVESKANILAQLKKMVKKMRALPAPTPGVANVIGGPLYDS
ncbi:hypothetical protein V8E55_007734 [Tylopilus felleus]